MRNFFIVAGDFASMLESSWASAGDVPFPELVIGWRIAGAVFEISASSGQPVVFWLGPLPQPPEAWG